jgi:hypothetical protein
MKYLKLAIMVLIALIVIALITGCSRDPIIYDGKLQEIEVVEEIISDKLEVDNPSKDLEVTITEEIDD